MGPRRRGLGDCATLIESVAMACSIELALRILPFAKLLAWLDRLTPGRAKRGAVTLERLGRFASVACGLLPVRSTCLRESLVLYGLLRRSGAVPKLCVGVRKNGAELAAHAWIECDGIAPADGTASFGELRAVQTTDRRR